MLLLLHDQQRQYVPRRRQNLPFCQPIYLCSFCQFGWKTICAGLSFYEIKVKFMNENILQQGRILGTHEKNIDCSNVTTRRVKQVAQLWQTDRPPLHAKSQNCIFEPPYGGLRGNISNLSGSFNAKKRCSRV